MTILAVGIGVLAGISLFLGWYFRQAEAGVVKAGPVWDRVSANLNRFVMDEAVPESVAREVTIFAAIAGCGCLAISFVLHSARKDISKRYRARVETEPLPKDLAKLGAAQRQLLSSILGDLVRIDLLRSPILRPILRRAVKSAVRGNPTDKASVRTKNIQSLMNAAHGAADWQMKLRKLPQEVATLAREGGFKPPNLAT